MSIELFAHQRKAVELARERKRHAFFWSCGTGKTIAMLAVCAERPVKTLVVCPKSIMRAAWAEDARHFPQLNTVVCWSDRPSERDRLIQGPWDIAVTNYETMKRHAAEFLSVGVRRLIVDESSKVKQHDSQTTRCVHAIADRVDEVYLLSGTPAPNNGTEYFGQLRALGRDVVGVSYWGFASRLFIPQKKKIRVGAQVKEVVVGWTQTEQQKQKLAEILAGCSWSLRKEECLDLPGKTDRLIDVELNADERRAYKAAAEEFRFALKDDETEGSGRRFAAEAAAMKLRQITGGVVLLDGERQELGESKLDALEDALDEIGADEPVVIWAEFTHDIDRIAMRMEQRGEPSAIIDGRTSSAAGETARAFQAGEIRRLICHPAAAGHGITLTRASYAIYYGLSFSFELYEQSRDRIHRAGQTRPCTYLHLIAPETIDESLLRVVRRKASVSDEFRRLAGKVANERGRIAAHG